jgi:hypothetical protein
MFDWFGAYAATAVVAYVPGVILLGLFAPAARQKRLLLLARALAVGQEPVDGITTGFDERRVRA